MRYRTKEGIKRYKTLGPHGKITVEQGRTKALHYFHRVQQGDDPIAEEVALRRAPTVAELAERYMTEHSLVKKKPGSIRPDTYNLCCHVLPALGTKKVAAVTRADIAALHHAMRETPGAANRVLALLSKMFTLAEQWGLRPEGNNPVRHIQRYRERRFDRFLSAEELARLGEVLAEAERTQTEYASVLAAIRLLIFTGARLSEILALRWQQVDFDHACLRLPESKTGAKLIYLSPLLLQSSMASNAMRAIRMSSSGVNQVRISSICASHGPGFAPKLAYPTSAFTTYAIPLRPSGQPLASRYRSSAKCSGTIMRPPPSAMPIWQRIR